MTSPRSHPRPRSGRGSRNRGVRGDQLAPFGGLRPTGRDALSSKN